MIKKIFFIAGITLFSLFIALSALSLDIQTPTAYAAIQPDCDPASGDLSMGGGKNSGCGLDDFQTLLTNIITYLTITIIPLGVGVIMYGGIVIMTAGGSESRLEKGKELIKTALWGLVIALGSLLIINSIFLAFTGKEANQAIKDIQKQGTN